MQINGNRNTRAKLTIAVAAKTAAKNHFLVNVSRKTARRRMGSSVPSF